ncbi:hypothetical protein [Lacticaseibacillus daqingensis]|uniref:hypothetical protein n=1 Tax=Lacticaseibacillus daqingensis TaxID=2486014 RepID=UPI000F76C1B0|nr:hypothetical protein [Lacticaseibacillus daqingensis]
MMTKTFGLKRTLYTSMTAVALLGAGAAVTAAGANTQPQTVSAAENTRVGTTAEGTPIVKGSDGWYYPENDLNDESDRYAVVTLIIEDENGKTVQTTKKVVSINRGNYIPIEGGIPNRIFNKEVSISFDYKDANANATDSVWFENISKGDTTIIATLAKIDMGEDADPNSVNEEVHVDVPTEDTDESGNPIKGNTDQGGDDTTAPGTGTGEETTPMDPTEGGSEGTDVTPGGDSGEVIAPEDNTGKEDTKEPEETTDTDDDVDQTDETPEVTTTTSIDVVIVQVKEDGTPNILVSQTLAGEPGKTIDVASLIPDGYVANNPDPLATTFIFPALHTPDEGPAILYVHKVGDKATDPVDNTTSTPEDTSDTDSSTGAEDDKNTSNGDTTGTEEHPNGTGNVKGGTQGPSTGADNSSAKTKTTPKTNGEAKDKRALP